MTTNNHPAHGPVSLERLHQISEILSKAAAQSAGGNLGYAMADAVKVIDVAIAAFCAEPVAYMYKDKLHTDARFSLDTRFGNWSQEDINEYEITEIPLYTAPPVPVVPDEITPIQASRAYGGEVRGYRDGWNTCRTTMLQAGNSPVIPYCRCRTCRPVTMSDMRFVVCPDCGNKRCPHANDHRNACTGSNEPGQIGSAYPAAPQQEVK
ncbi:hypothetical protein GBD53_17325 [Salmonella enterica]|nr:hypothetical protein [Salmonella enterica]